MVEVELFTAVEEEDMNEEGGVVGAADDRDDEVSDPGPEDGAIDQARDGVGRVWGRDALWVCGDDQFPLSFPSLSVPDRLGPGVESLLVSSPGVNASRGPGDKLIRVLLERERAARGCTIPDMVDSELNSETTLGGLVTSPLRSIASMGCKGLLLEG